MVRRIKKLPIGEVVKPSTVGMENERDTFYRLINFVDCVKKIGDERIKIS